VWRTGHAFRGMRIRVTGHPWDAAEGLLQEEILKDFPYLERDDIKAALAYAATSG